MTEESTRDWLSRKFLPRGWKFLGYVIHVRLRAELTAKADYNRITERLTDKNK